MTKVFFFCKKPTSQLKTKEFYLNNVKININILIVNVFRTTTGGGAVKITDVINPVIG